jgi:hypothetical protein
VPWAFKVRHRAYSTVEGELKISGNPQTYAREIIGRNEGFMPSIIARRRKDGTVGYTARIRIRRGKQILHEEAMTFSRLTPARNWAAGRELELEKPTVLNEARKSPVALGNLIRWYRETFERVSNWRRTKTQHLRFLENHPLAAINVRELTTQSLIAHVRDRRASGAGPATVSGDLTWIGVVLRAAKSVLSETVNPDIVDEARRACRELRLIGRSRKLRLSWNSSTSISTAARTDSYA